jgi:hypothetical protein
MRKGLAAVLLTLLVAQVPAASRVALVTEAQITGATLRIEVLPPVDDKKAAEIVEWLRSASGNVSLAYGRFPVPSPRIVVVPTGNSPWGGNSPVPFGRVTRNGEEKVEFFVNAERPIEEFYDDWTATHEFSHLMLPYVSGRHKWISEGFASYYQNVLMSRAGRYTPKRAWTKLHEGFERGRASRPELSLNDAAASGIRRRTSNSASARAARSRSMSRWIDCRNAACPRIAHGADPNCSPGWIRSWKNPSSCRFTAAMRTAPAFPT